MARAAPVRHPAERGAIATSLGKLAQVVFFLVLAWLFSILVEWAGMTFFWPEQGRYHSEAMLAAELGYLNDDFERSALVERPKRFARRTADLFHEYAYRKTGIERALVWALTPTDPPSRLHGWLKGALRAVSDYLLAAITITQVFAVRLAVLILALPAFVLLGLTAFIDGLVERDLRRWGGGRETSWIYHWAKKFVSPALALPWIVYLSLPVSVHPNWVILPFAVLFAGAIAVMASRFKKYA